MFRKLRDRARTLRASGLKLRRVLFSPFASRVLPPEARPASARQSRKKGPPETPVAPKEILDGPSGGVIRRAVDDRTAILEILIGLSKTVRAMLPDLAPTVEALVDRVKNLAGMIHRVEQGIDPGLNAEVDARIRATEQEPSSQARDRKLAFLAKQRASLDDMLSHRMTLQEQLESAGLALGTLRLDVMKLRSSGLPSAMADVTTATQEARALSHEIGHVLDALAEARRL
jgi:serine/threonine-protein kinase